MNRRLNALALGALLLLCSAGLSAQNVFVTPAQAGFSPNVTVFGANPFSQAGAFAANQFATQVYTADGSKFYVVCTNGVVFTVDSTFTNVRQIASLGPLAATASLLTSNGRYLVVATQSVHIFDTSTDTEVTGVGINMNGTVVDMAVNLESTRLFVLVNPNIQFGTQLVAIDLTTNPPSTLGAAPIGNLGIASAVSTAPNDLVYVSTSNAIFEIDPRNFTVRQQIAVVGRPGKMAFTPDGKLGIVPNLTPFTGNAIYTMDVNSRIVTPIVATASLPANVFIDKIFPIATNRFFAYSSINQVVLDITLNPVIINGFSLASLGTVSAAGITNDIATPLHPITQYFFFIAGGSLNRLDLSAAQLSGQLPVPNGSGNISVATAPVTGTPATLLTFGDNQSVGLGGTSLPLVVRLVDSLGRPLKGVPVTFSTATPGVALAASVVNTNNDGFAVLSSVVAPNVIGPFNILAQAAGGLSASFTVSAGIVGGGVTGGLSIVSGQGQLVLEQSSSNPLMVLLKDVSGNPVSGANVTFTLTQGSGTITGGISTVLNSTVVTTSSDGTASVSFLAPQISCAASGCIPTPPAFQGAIISATTDAGASVTFFITTGSIAPSFQPTVFLIKPSVGDTLSGQAGQTLKGAIQVQVFSGSGVGIPNVAISFDSMFASAASCAGTFALTDMHGNASCDLVLGSQVGLSQVFANVGGYATVGPFNVNITPAPASKISIVQGDKQSGNPGDTLKVPLIVQVTDAFGNLLSGQTVTFKVATPGSLTLVNVSSTTDANGRASASVKLGNTAGNFQITAGITGASVTFTETVAVPPGGLLLVSGNGQSAVLNTTFSAPLVVKAVDANGNGIVGAQVTFAITSGSAIFVGSATPTTDAQGNASVNIQAGGTAGSITVTATFGAFNVVFTLTAQQPGPGNVVFLNGASFVQNSISPGAIVTIRGNRILTGVQGLFTAFNILGPLPTSFPIPANLGSGSILFNGVAAPVFYVSNINGVETVTVQVPFETPTGQVTVTINAVGGGTAQVQVNVQPLAPGVFTTMDGNQTIAVAQRPDGTYVSSNNPAHRNDRLRFYVTGLGQVSPAAVTGSPGVAGQSVIASLIVGLNNVGVNLVSAEYAPGLVGVYVVTLDVPGDAVLGAAQPVGIIAVDSLGNQYFAAGTSIPIQ